MDRILPVIQIILFLGTVGGVVMVYSEPPKREVTVTFTSDTITSALNVGQHIYGKIAFTYADYKKFTKAPFDGVVIALEPVDPILEAKTRKIMTDRDLVWSPTPPEFFVWNPIEKEAEAYLNMRGAYDFYQKVLAAKCGGGQ